MTVPTPGIHSDIPFDVYADWDALNVSTLIKGRKSMAHCQVPWKERNEGMRKGVFGHGCFLQPIETMGQYAVMPDYANDPDNVRADGSKPDKPASTGWYKKKAAEFAATNSGREVVTQQWYDDMLGALKAVKAHPKASECLAPGGQAEVSLVWTDAETGILRKARLDYIRDAQKVLADLKFTDDVSRFERTIDRFGYHIRMASYVDAWLVLTGVKLVPWLIAIEPHAPYGIRCGPIGKQTMILGHREYRLLLKQYFDCILTGEWSGYEDVDEWNLPGVGQDVDTYGLQIAEAS